MRMSFFLIVSFLFGMTACESQKTGGGKQEQSPGGLLSAAAFKDKFAATAGAMLIDVRTPGELNRGKIAGASHWDYNTGAFSEAVKTLDKNKPYFVYCAAGGRSASAVQEMKQLGFKEIYELDGGMGAWVKNGLPVELPEQPKAPEKPSADEKSGNLSDADFKSLVSSEKIVLVDFYAPWCGPCRQMEPMLDQLSKAYAGRVKIIRIDTDQNQDLAMRLKISAIPYFHLYKEGKQVWDFIGATDKASLEKVFKSHL